MEERLIEASRENDLTTVRRIMRKPGGVNINYRNNLGESAILLAASGGHTEILKILIEHTCYINNPNGILLRPLHLACKGDHLNVVKLLLNAGAAIDVKTSDGFRPIDFANYNTPVHQILYRHAPGVEYKVEEPSEGLPEVPDYALAQMGIVKKAKASSGKKGKKGKKGGKKGKKGGKKVGKKGGKKKKRK